MVCTAPSASNPKAADGYARDRICAPREAGFSLRSGPTSGPFCSRPTPSPDSASRCAAQPGKTL